MFVAVRGKVCIQYNNTYALMALGNKAKVVFQVSKQIPYDRFSVAIAAMKISRNGLYFRGHANYIEQVSKYKLRSTLFQGYFD